MRRLPNSEIKARLKATRAAMTREEIDALLVVDPSNIRYLTGYVGEGVQVFVTKRGMWLLATERNVQRAEQTTDGVAIVDVKQRPRFVARWGEAHRPKAIGVCHSMSRAMFEWWKKALRPTRLKPSTAIQNCRAIKSPREIRALRKAQRATDEVFDRLLGEVKPGMTERALHHRLLQLILDRDDLDGAAFDPIVCSGPSAWATHSHYTDRRIGRNDCVIFDFGARCDGYCADMTRTLFTGKPTVRMREVYAIVQEAQELAFEQIKTGAQGSDAGLAVHQWLEKHGVAETMSHGLGHGVGLDIHEAPMPGLATTSKTVLKPGMVVTVEPGVYLKGRFGVRIEDTVVVREGGFENLSKSTKELTIVS